MRRRLLILNLALLAAVAAGVWRWRLEYRRAQARYQILDPAATRPASAAAPAAETAAPAPVSPANFFDSAAKFLFSADRNPTVVVEPPKVKPRPELPVVIGLMNIGAGPVVIMAPAVNRPHKAVRIGEKIGEFELAAATPEKITLKWEGQSIESPLSDLLARNAPQPQTTQTPEAAPTRDRAPEGNASPLLNPANAPKPGEYIIGKPMQVPSGTIYASPSGDTAPHGTIYQGKRKVVRKTLFGTESWWEDIN